MPHIFYWLDVFFSLDHVEQIFGTFEHISYNNAATLHLWEKSQFMIFSFNTCTIEIWIPLTFAFYQFRWNIFLLFLIFMRWLCVVFFFISTTYVFISFQKMTQFSPKKQLQLNHRKLVFLFFLLFLKTRSNYVTISFERAEILFRLVRWKPEAKLRPENLSKTQWVGFTFKMFHVFVGSKFRYILCFAQDVSYFLKIVFNTSLIFNRKM